MSSKISALPAASSLTGSELTVLVQSGADVQSTVAAQNALVTSVSGNAGTATALQTARNINGVSFNGTANITVTAAAGTLTGTGLNSTVVSASLTTNNLTANSASAFSMTDGTTLYIAINTQTGTSSVAAITFSYTSPTITAASGVTLSAVQVAAQTVNLSGATTVTAMDGLALYLGAQTVTDSSGVTVSTMSNLYVALPIAGGSVTGTNIYAAHFAGACKLDGNLNVSGQATTITAKSATAVSFNISDGTTNYMAVDTRTTTSGVKSVTFSCSAPTIASASGMTFSVAAVAAYTLTASGNTGITALDGLALYLDVPTVSAGHQTTEASTLFVAVPVFSNFSCTNLFAAHFAGGIRVDGNIDATNGASIFKFFIGATGLIFQDSNANPYVTFNSNQNGNVLGAGGLIVAGNGGTVTAASVTAGGNSLYIKTKTYTVTGTGTATSWLGGALYVDTITWTDASAGTITSASAVHINAIAAAGGSLTITNSYMISTSVSTCYLTNAGVWTSFVSGAGGKKEIRDVEGNEIMAVLEKIRPRTWKYRPEVHGDDSDRQRFGIVAEELPEAFRIPGPYPVGGVSGGLLGSFALAALKALKDENTDLKNRLARLENLLGVS